MREDQVRVSIVIPNWNGAKLLKKHLPEVLLAAPEAEIIVVDDHSTDDSVRMLKRQFPEVRTIVKERNRGFSQSVNTGVMKSRGDVVVLLNTDVAPQKGFLAPLIRHFSDPSVFAVGCLEKNPERKGVVLRGRGIAHWQKGFYIHARGEVNTLDTAWVAGGSGAFRRTIWNTLGGLDTMYNPFYWEDIDISYRAVKAGYRIVFEPKSVVWHYHQKGAIKTQFQQHRIDRIAFRNQFLFIWKNVTDPRVFLAHLFWTPIRIVQQLLRGQTAILIGFVFALGRIGNVLEGRKSTLRLWKKTDRDIAVY